MSTLSTCLGNNGGKLFKTIISVISVVWLLDVSTDNFISVLLALLFWYAYKNEDSEPQGKVFHILAILLAFFHVIGNYMLLVSASGGNSLTHAKCILCIAGWYCIFHMLITCIYRSIKSKSLRDEEIQVNIQQERKIYLFTFICCVICWLPYYLSYFPGSFSPDSTNQIMQALGIVEYSNHHPVTHTLLLKGCYNFGFLLSGNENIGAATCTLVQMLLMAAIFSYLVIVLYHFKIKKMYLVLCVIYYALFPVNAVFSITIWKDVLFAGITLLFVVLLWKMNLLEKEKNNKNATSIRKEGHILIIGFIVIGTLFSLMRSNGFYAFIVCGIVMCLLLKNQRRPMIISVLAVIMIVCLIKGPVMEVQGIRQPDLIENLSIPSQHIARVIVTGNELEPEEYELLNRVIDIERIPEVYKPYLSDPIKDLVREKGNQDYIEEHKKDFLLLWIKLGLRYPGEYINAQIAQTKGYWETDAQYWVIWTELHEPLNNVNIYRDSLLPQGLNRVVENILSAYHGIPLVGMLYSIGFYFWVTLFLLAVCLKKKKTILPFIPVLALWGTLMIATPVYAEFRYMYSMVVCLPFFIAITCSDMEEEFK